MEKEGAGKKVLVVDDKEENRRLVRKVLTLHGYSIIEVATGELAIEAAQSGRPDLILMDLRLREGIDGIETTRLLKALPSVAHIPVVAIDIDEFPEQVGRYLA
jgi:CheY-like chemotaxis protein